MEPSLFMCTVCNENINGADRARQHWLQDHNRLKRKKRAVVAAHTAHEKDAGSTNGTGDDEGGAAVSHEDGFKCDYCDHVASAPRYKLLHEKRVHLNLDCKTCTRVFKDGAERDSHVCVKPDRFQCSQCNKSYKVTIGSTRICQ